MKSTNDVTELFGGLRANQQEWVLFAAICPKCRQQVLQHGYSRVLLFGFLDVDYPIEAYCAPCDEIWPISAQERRAVIDALSPTRSESLLGLTPHRAR
jgi:hypothetical protein